MAIPIPSVPEPAVSLNFNGTLHNGGPGNLYYRDEFPVDATTNDGTLAAGSNLAVNGIVWLISNPAGCSVVVIPAPTSSGGSSANVFLVQTADGYPDREDDDVPRIWIGWDDPTDLMAESDLFVPIPEPS